MMQPPPRPPRQGTSKAVPVVVSAGLAVGVFCGLLFGLGTGDKASAEPPKTVTAVHKPDDAPVPVATKPTPPPPPPPKVVAAGSGSAGSGGGIGSATVALAGSAATPAAKAMKLTLTIEPDAAAQVAVISIDGKQITGMSTDVPLATKQIHVLVIATGFHSIDQKVDLKDGDEATVALKMVKRAAGGPSPGFGGPSTGGNHVPTTPPKPKKPSSGIIDI